LDKHESQTVPEAPEEENAVPASFAARAVAGQIVFTPLPRLSAEFV
jgi:hypothetical protein